MSFILKSTILGANWVHLGSIHHHGIGEILLNIPKQSGGVNQYNKEENSRHLEKSKSETISEMGYSKDQASDYQRMAQNQAVTSSGIENTNTVKFGRCVAELERIYGIRNGSANEKGNNRIGERPNVSDKTQSDLAEDLGVDKKTLQRAKKLAELPEEFQQMVMEDKITPSIASRMIARLTPEEQKQLLEQIGGKNRDKSNFGKRATGCKNRHLSEI